MSDPIRDALREAARDMNGRMADRGYEVPWPEDGRLIAAAAVAAFLRVIARQHVEDCDRDGVPGDPMGVGAWLDDIAAAVEAAGRE